MLHTLMLNRSWEVWTPPGSYSTVELDLGCGKGGFLVELAARYPDRLILGVDVLKGRLQKVERKLWRRELGNAELLCTTGWELVGYQLPDRCLDRVHVLCPDPWPKAKHAARRLLSSEFLGRLASKLKPGGILHLATDDDPYFAEMQIAIEPLRFYELAPDGIADVADIKTDFELQWEAEGKTVNHLAFRRLPGTTPHVDEA